MAEEAVAASYGYVEDTEAKVNPFKFGLNKDCRLIKFEWIPNGGKDGAEGEALDIVFLINGVEKGYRQFPVTQGFDKQNNPVTDPKSPEFRDAMMEMNQRAIHVVHAFQESDVIKQALSRPFPGGFKEWCKALEALLPPNFKDKPLDIFLNFQWQIGANANKTYLDLPKKTAYGKYIVASDGKDYEEQRKENPDDNDKAALVYVATPPPGVEGEPVYHPFVRNGWFMNSHFAIQQKDNSVGESSTGSTLSTTGTPAPTGEAAKKAW